MVKGQAHLQVKSQDMLMVRCMRTTISLGAEYVGMVTFTNIARGRVGGCSQALVDSQGQFLA